MTVPLSESKNVFEDVSLLITHYNRSSSLERLMNAFKDLNVVFKEIVVSDDSSSPEHIDRINKLKKEFEFTFITVAKNKGLGNNINKGQLAISTPYTLYVQEDFVPLPDFVVHFKDSLEIMNSDQSIDIIRYYAYAPYPYMKPFKKGFSELIYKPWFLDKNKIYYYSDHPHLRRSNFFDRFGQYQEGLKVDKTEYSMCLAFIQNKGKGLFYDKYDSLFRQENSAEEPSTVKRSNWRHSGNYFISFIRLIYREIKYNYDLHIHPRFKK